MTKEEIEKFVEQVFNDNNEGILFKEIEFKAEEKAQEIVDYNSKFHYLILISRLMGILVDTKEDLDYQLSSIN